MPGHSIKQRAERKIAVELAQITQRNNWTSSVFAFTNLQKCPHGDTYWMYKYKYLHLKYKYEYKYFKTIFEYKYKYQVLHLW